MRPGQNFSEKKKNVSERKKNKYKFRQTSGREIPSCCNFHNVIKSCRERKSWCLPLFYLLFPLAKYHCLLNEVID